MSAFENNTIILGLGDPELRDGGTGQFLTALLSHVDMPGNVRILDCGTSPECHIDHLGAYHRIIVLTSYLHGDAPGEIFFATLRGDLTGVLSGVPAPMESVRSQLITMFNSGKIPEDTEWILVGIEPKQIAPGCSLSDDVIKAAPKVLQRIHDLLWESNHKKEDHYHYID